MRVADLVFDSRTSGKEGNFTYLADAETSIGQARFANVGTRTALGFVSSIYEATEADLGFSFDALRPLGEAVENLSLPEEVIALAKFVAAEYLCPLPVALSAATPPGILDRIVSAWSIVPEAKSEGELSAVQLETLRAIADSGGALAESPSKRLPAGTLKALRMLQAKGLVKSTVRVAPFQERRRAKDYLQLTADLESIEKFLKTEGKKKPAQALTLMRLQGAEHASLSISEIKALAGVTETTVQALVERQFLLPSDPDEAPLAKPPKANPFQALAIDAVTDSIRKRRAQGYLLFGVTGSGKTEVYLRLVAEALKQGRQALYVVPEIALATQAIAQLRERFGKGVALLHSELSPGERLQNWSKIREGGAGIVLGARSALFAPLDNLGVIVVDEEHEASYKQESSPRYHAKTVARRLADLHGCPFVLGSATPSIESFQETETNDLTLLSLPERAANAKLPEVHVLDLAEGYRSGSPTILSDELLERMDRVLAKGEQAILFLNRRAYAPFIVCRDCGHQMLCPRCSVSLTYHRRVNKLVCHHCDFRVEAPMTCPVCNGVRLKPFGIGTEKVEEAVREAFPTYEAVRLDRDVAQKKGALESVIAGFRANEYQILVGTQMVAKGLDFPNVTMVGVIAADLSLNIPDIRSSERTFQLLSQVAGRAGRGKIPGEVVIQTFNPGHIAVECARTHDYLAFFEALRAERQESNYPPFCRLVNVVLSGEDRDSVIQASRRMLERLQSVLAEPKSEVLGPADCPLERLNNRWRRHLLLKLHVPDSPASIGETFQDLKFRGVQVVVDVDPYNLM